MAISLADIRARLAAAEQSKSPTKATGTSDNSVYPHWNMDEGTTATLRPLPDGDPTNPYFWVEKNIIKLPFNGVKGVSGSKRVEVQVPCIEMFGPDYHCPILAEVRPWYKDESLKEMANKYWKKRSYLMQGFVRVNPIADDKGPVDAIRRFIISPQIMPIVKAGLLDPEVDELPTDYLRGLDLNIKKTTKGSYADYSTSTWARKESALTAGEQAMIASQGLYNLSDFLPKMPTETELRIMVEMFNASVDGEPYDNERWGHYYRPWGLDAPTGTAPGNTSAPARVATPTPTPAAKAPAAWEDDVKAAEAPVVTEAPAAVAAPAATSTGDKAADIIAMIRARQTKTA